MIGVKQNLLKTINSEKEKVLTYQAMSLIAFITNDGTTQNPNPSDAQ